MTISFWYLFDGSRCTTLGDCSPWLVRILIEPSRPGCARTKRGACFGGVTISAYWRDQGSNLITDKATSTVIVTPSEQRSMSLVIRYLHPPLKSCSPILGEGRVGEKSLKSKNLLYNYR
jgi:hypothetical protein